MVAEPDERGAFYFDKLPFGSYVVQAQADGQIARASCRLSREAPVADVLLILQGADGISGRVVDPLARGGGRGGLSLLLDGQERQSSAVLADATVADGQGSLPCPGSSPEPGPFRRGRQDSPRPCPRRLPRARTMR